MKKNYFHIFIGSLIIAIIGVFVVDYFSHKFFSNPMETIPYFFAKAAWYVIFSFLFLSFMNLKKKEFGKVLIGGIIVSALWGAYYNVFPVVFDYYPFGMSLYGLSFLGMGLLGTGIAFGTVHTLAFIVGYYASRRISEEFK
jgi:uncharacterized BrkB/YihY/UPF0761 family membrane protein